MNLLKYYLNNIKPYDICCEVKRRFLYRTIPCIIKLFFHFTNIITNIFYIFTIFIKSSFSL